MSRYTIYEDHTLYNAIYGIPMLDPQTKSWYRETEYYKTSCCTLAVSGMRAGKHGYKPHDQKGGKSTKLCDVR